MKTRCFSIVSAALMAVVISLGSCTQSVRKKDRIDDGVKTTFQTSRGWRPTIDNRADAVMVYGVGGNPSDRHRGRATFEERVQSWKDRGYKIHFMTGIAWGEYQDYFTGQWDGEWHLDEGQVQANGDTIWHGRLVPYIVPTENYLKYFKEKHIKRVIDAGVTDIFLEEPEFWARAGYSEAFKREWKEYYGFDWRPQHESPENTYLSSKLKYHLYYRALEESFTYAKEYGRSKGLDVRCYVPTHSLVNYSQWQIVSPEASLASMDCVDGYIAQVWTGTSRGPDYFNGVVKERVFETAFLEYNCMASMTAPTGRKMFFLTDPIEDWPRDWADYKKNYQATFTAQLLFPSVSDFEVMPWPERVYEGLYRIAPGSEEKARIPAFYATQMQVMVNSLNKMPGSDNKLSGSQGVSVLMANSLMFQRFPRHKGYDDPQLANFYGMAMPFVKRGVPVSIVHMENLAFEECLKDTKVLLMTYSNMKPMDPVAHKYLAKWVKKGGMLVFCGRDDDPFQSVYEWWNTGKENWNAPSDHLFSLMGIPAGAEAGTYNYGKGSVTILRNNPKEFVLTEGGDAEEIATVKALYEADGATLEFKNNFTLSRGNYLLAAVVDESVSDEPLVLDGCYIDVFDPELPVLAQKTVAPGTQVLLVDLAKVDKTKPAVVASASRESDEVITENSYSFIAKGPQDTKAVTRVVLPAQPSSVTIDGVEVLDEAAWDAAGNTYVVKYDNSPEGTELVFRW